MMVSAALGMLLLAAGLPADPQAAHRAAYLSKPVALGAHRGGRGEWPENTAVAFAECARRWPDIVLEGDLHTTADGALVVLHDGMVQRTTEGTGAVSGMTLAEVKALDAGYRFTADGGKSFPYRGQGIRIPTFAEALAAAPQHRFLFEMKGGPGIVEATVAAVRAAKAEGRVVLAAFNPIFTGTVRKTAPELLTCYDTTTAMQMIAALRQGDWAAYRATDLMLSISPDMERRFAIAPDEIAKVREKGVVVQMHTINEADEMRRYAALPVDSILTDYPSRLAEVLAQGP